MYIFEKLLLYCFKYNYKFDIQNDEIFFIVCYNYCVDIIKKIINNI